MNRTSSLLKFLPFIPLAVILSSVLPPQAIAGMIEPTPVPCWFFRGESIELQQTCSFESISWAGGWQQKLRWEDGVVTVFAYGLQGRGERLCEDTSLDGVCGSSYYRDPNSLERIPEDKARQIERPIRCVQPQQNSVCWRHPY
jgi:hypothetical protein